MDNSFNTNTIQQQVLRASQQDGFIEIWLGIFFLYYAVFFDNFARELPTNTAMIVLFIFIANFPLFHFKVIRNVFTYPRIGYVKIKMKIPIAPILTFIIPIVALPLITYIGVHWMKDLVDISLMLRLMSVLFGITFAALYFVFARKFGLIIYHILAALSVLLGIFLSFVQMTPPAVTLFLVFQSFFLLSYGIYMLLRFISKYPKPMIKPNHYNDLKNENSTGVFHDQ